MGRLLNILKEMNISEALFVDLQYEVTKCSIGCGKSVDEIKELSDEYWDIMDDVSNRIWNLEVLNLQEKVILGFDFYHELPNYYHCLIPVYHVVRDTAGKDPAVLKIIWDKIAYYIGREEKFYVDTMSYILWVEFFENQQTVRVAWYGILQSPYLTMQGKINILDCCGPVPYDVKEKLYKDLLKFSDFHINIMRSLLFSATDIYGDIDKMKAKILLEKLKVDSNDEMYNTLCEKLVGA